MMTMGAMFSAKGEGAMRDATIFGRLRSAGRAAFLGGCVGLAAATMSGARAGDAGFASPEEGAAALAAAAKNDDASGLERILGPDSNKLVESGDAVADSEGRKKFAAAYDELHTVEHDGDRRATILVGHDEWPLPIPLVKEGAFWRFDTKAGEQEILARRIGRNELGTLKTVRAYVEAQREYASLDRDSDGVRDYAQRFLSSEGRHDGLYWPAAAGEAESPIGPLVASAREEGYSGTGANTQQTPYHGYFFKILTRQGPHAAGGAHDYVADGHMIGGFGLVAFPARWGDSGVMSFIVNQDGQVYEKDLGRDTARVARAMTAYDPDPSWHPVAP